MDNIETRIARKFQAEDGDWVFEKGKVVEGKLLKEAVARIKSLTSNNAKLDRLYRDQMDAKHKVLRGQNEAVKELEKQKRVFYASLERFEDSLHYTRSRTEETAATVTKLKNTLLA